MTDGDGVHVVDHSMIGLCHYAGMYKVVIVQVRIVLRVSISPRIVELLIWKEQRRDMFRFENSFEISRWGKLSDGPILVGERAYSR